MRSGLASRHARPPVPASPLPPSLSSQQLDNLLFGSDWRLLLADFGVATCVRWERAVTRAGTGEAARPR